MNGDLIRVFVQGRFMTLELTQFPAKHSEKLIVIADYRMYSGLFIA